MQTKQFKDINAYMLNKVMLFRVKCLDGHVFKMLTELIQMTMKSAYFTIDAKGMFMRVTDVNMFVLFDLELLSDNFLLFEFNHTEPLKVGLNLKHLYKMLKSMKKKDSIEMLIQDKLDNLQIRVIPRENNRVSESYIKLHEFQNIAIELPGEDSQGPKYNGKPVTILSNDFQKMIKDLCSISNDIKIRATERSITFCCMVDNVLSKQITFGNDIHDHRQTNEPIIYEGDFDIVQILTIIKIAGLNRQIQMFCTTGLPILLKSHVGSIGELRIYIKSKDMIDI